MAFKRLPLAELEPTNRALARGEYEVAFALLETAAQRPRSSAFQATYRLHLAGLYALYGEEGIEGGALELRTAARIDPTIVRQPLYQSLYWEFASYRGESLSEVKRGLKEISALEDPVAGYHAACALLAADAPKSAARILVQLDVTTLPTHLDWRRWSRLGQALQKLGKLDQAVEPFQHAVALSTGGERESERLNLASCQLEIANLNGALNTLENVDDQLLSDNEDFAVKRYLLGRIHLERNNPNQALESLLEGYMVEGLGAGTAFSISYVTGQSLVALGRFNEAIEVFEEAIELAEGEDRSLALHEQAYAFIESERYEEARAVLEEILSDPSYTLRAEGFGDLADVLFRTGDYEAAEALSIRALDLGATAVACLCLGNIAFECFRYEDAATWYEKAASASKKGSPNWVGAQQMLADVFAQLGSGSAPRLLQHAEAAIGHTDPSTDWYLTLTRYIEFAQAQLGGNDRSLN
jgi:tetratricopeptide (TPR) repeat protein